MSKSLVLAHSLIAFTAWACHGGSEPSAAEQSGAQNRGAQHSGAPQAENSKEQRTAELRCPDPPPCPHCPEAEAAARARPDDWKREGLRTLFTAPAPWPQIDLDGDGKAESIKSGINTGKYQISVVDGVTARRSDLDWSSEGGKPFSSDPTTGYGLLTIDARGPSKQLFICFGAPAPKPRCHVLEYYNKRLRDVGVVGEGVATDGDGHVFGTDEVVASWHIEGAYDYVPGEPLKPKAGDVFAVSARFSGGGKIRKVIGGPVWWLTDKTLQAVAVSTGHKQKWYLVTWGGDQLGWVPHEEVYAELVASDRD